MSPHHELMPARSHELLPATPAAANSEEIDSFETEYTEIVETNPTLAMEQKAETAGKYAALVLMAPIVYLLMIPMVNVIAGIWGLTLTSISFTKSFFLSCWRFYINLIEGFRYPKWIQQSLTRMDNSVFNAGNKLSSLFNKIFRRGR